MLNAARFAGLGGRVFAIGRCDSTYQRQMLSYYKMGDGPYYLFYRPYHLCHIGAMKTVIEVVSQGACFLLKLLARRMTEVKIVIAFWF